MPVIKRYPNRKLYDTEAKQYITLDGIADLIRQGEDISVVDYSSGEDLTALTLTQIILEHEKHQGGLLSNATLTNLIRAGGDRLNQFQRRLAASMDFLKQIDEEIKGRVQALVRQGELSEAEGKSLIKKLLDQKLGSGEGRALSNDEVETFLRERQVPTQADVQRLSTQLEELAAKLDGLKP